jgi:hypothetical protein
MFPAIQLLLVLIILAIYIHRLKAKNDILIYFADNFKINLRKNLIYISILAFIFYN